MNDLNAAYDAMVHHPLAGIALTLIAFKLAVLLNRKTGWLIFQPVLMSTVFIVIGLTVLDIGYEEYRVSTAIIVLLLGPATVALALPLYRSIALIRHMWMPVTVTLLLGGTFTVVLVVALGKLFGIEHIMVMTLVPKSVTTPVAILITEKIGGVIGVVPVFVLLSGIMGAMIGPLLLRVCGVTHPAATGMAIGLTSHAIGTSRLFELNQQAAGFGALAMSLMAVVSAIVLPFIAGLLGAS
jgi:putative effector of murein hydrolase